MFCPNCSKEVELGASFCSNCGTSVPVVRSELQAAPTSRPLGVVLVSIYTAITGVLTIFWGLFLEQAGFIGSSIAAGFGSEFSRLGLKSDVPQVGWLAFLGELVYLFGVLGLAAGYGLWTLLRWGHTLANIFYAISILVSLIIALSSGPSDAGAVVALLVSIGIAIWVLVWLSNPSTRRLYGKQ